MKKNTLNNVWIFLEISDSNFLTQVAKYTQDKMFSQPTPP